MSTAGTNAELDAKVVDFDARLGSRTIEAVHEFLGRFVCYPSVHAHVAHTLWVLHAHLMDVWDSTPRIAFLSAEPASGKTRALEITERLVPNPVPTVNVSPAYLFRKVGSPEGATILFDEVDTVFGLKAGDHEDIRGLLNAGHRRGATTGRCVVRGNEVMLEELPAYAAVALAGIGWLPDTILSRSIIIRMRRRHANERVESFRPRLHESEGWRLRDMIATWAKSVSREVTWPELPSQICDRDADVWESLIAVADVIGGDWPEKARRAAVVLVSESKEVEPSLGVRLLGDLRTVFTDDEMSSKSILHALYNIEEAPWSELKGKPLDERGLAYRLRQYGVRPKTVRLGATTARGYARADLVDVWERYLRPLAETSNTSNTSNTTVHHVPVQYFDSDKGGWNSRRKNNAVSDVLDVSPSAGEERVCVHCHQAGGAFCVASVGGETLWLHVSCKDSYRP